MAGPVANQERRGRGRPRKGAVDAREQILVAASEEFTENGYEAATIRAIASRAGVDPALVHHYFGNKPDLLAAVLGSPFRPDQGIPVLLDGPADQTGERIVRYILTTWDNPKVRKRTALLLRSALTTPATTALVAGFLQRELLDKVAARVSADDAELRAGLVSTQIAGLVVGRYLLRIPTLVNASEDVLVRRIGATVQRYLFNE